jgi:hypothetical protein
MARSKLGRCVYFNGIQNKACRAGVEYQSGPLPCLKDLQLRPDAPAPWACDKFQEPTQEQIDADEAEHKAHMAKMETVMKAIAGWRKEKPRGKQTVISCPTGCGGELHLSQAAYNGHVWGRCSTSGCVNWME